MTLYLCLKAFHVISVISWFAGLFYLPRLFVYHVETDQNQGDIQRQFGIMQRRLYYGIMWPAMIATILFGSLLAYQTGAWNETWFCLKVSLVLLLVVFHFCCGWIRKQLTQNQVPLNGKQLRLFNEIPTLILISIVLIIYLKSRLNLFWVAFIFLCSLATILGVIYSRRTRVTLPD